MGFKTNSELSEAEEYMHKRRNEGAYDSSIYDDEDCFSSDDSSQTNDSNSWNASSEFISYHDVINASNDPNVSNETPIDIVEKGKDTFFKIVIVKNIKFFLLFMILGLGFIHWIDPTFLFSDPMNFLCAALPLAFFSVQLCIPITIIRGIISAIKYAKKQRQD